MSAELTLAVPFHRGLGYLREAIESALAQRDARWRLVVLDDRGEPAGVRELVLGFGDPRIEYRAHDRHLGMVANWNSGLDAAATDLVALLHADDRLLPDYVGIALALASAHPRAAALFCGAVVIDAAGRPRFSLADAVKGWLAPRGEPLVLHGERALAALARGDFIMCPTLCFRRSLLGARRFDPRWRQVQDLDLLARLLLDGETLVGTRRAGYAYRRHAQSATARQSESLLRFEEEFELLERIAEAAARRGWSAAARVARRKAIVRLHLAWRAAGDLVAGRPGRALRLLRGALQGRAGLLGGGTR